MINRLVNIWWARCITRGGFQSGSSAPWRYNWDGMILRYSQPSKGDSTVKIRVVLVQYLDRMEVFNKARGYVTPSTLAWRSEGTGRKGRRSCLWSGQTTRTWSTSNLPNYGLAGAHFAFWCWAVFWAGFIGCWAGFVTQTWQPWATGTWM